MTLTAKFTVTANSNGTICKDCSKFKNPLDCPFVNALQGVDEVEDCSEYEQEKKEGKR